MAFIPETEFKGVKSAVGVQRPAEAAAGARQSSGSPHFHNLLAWCGMRATAGLALTAFVATTSAAPTVVARVTGAGTYGNGDVFVLLDTLIDEPGCPAHRIDLPASHPAARQVLAAALSAKAQNRQVEVLAAGCYSFPTLGVGLGGRVSYFYVL